METNVFIKLSRSDQKLLGALRLALTMGQIALAAHFGHSRRAVWRRMRELHDYGLIEGKVALLDAQKMGQSNGA